VESAVPAEKYHLHQLPVFDFARVMVSVGIDAFSSSFTGGIIDDLFKIGGRRLTTGNIRLPFPECLYLFSYAQTVEPYETPQTLHLREDEEGISRIQIWERGGRRRSSSQYRMALPMEGMVYSNISLMRCSPTRMFLARSKPTFLGEHGRVRGHDAVESAG
jgi:hypothetical protein